jgi:GH35 family endo-1,4-beta-xylanase
LGVKQSESACLKKSKTYTVTYPCGNEVIITNLNQFCKNNNLPQSNMIDVSRGINSQYKGWKCRPINLSKEEWMKIVTKNAKTKWYLIDPNGKEYWVRSKEFKQFCKEYGLSALSLQDVSSGKRDKIRGWSAKYIRSDYHNRSII